MLSRCYNQTKSLTTNILTIMFWNHFSFSKRCSLVCIDYILVVYFFHFYDEIIKCYIKKKSNANIFENRLYINIGNSGTSNVDSSNNVVDKESRGCFRINIWSHHPHLSYSIRFSHLTLSSVPRQVISFECNYIY